MDVVSFTFEEKNYVIKRLDTGTIELIIDDEVQKKIIKKLIEINNLLGLGISELNKKGNKKNTQTFGSDIMKLIKEKKTELKVEIKSIANKDILSNQNIEIDLNSTFPIEYNLNDFEKIQNAISSYLESIKLLKHLKVIKNQKDFTSQLGEWVASIIYKGKLAKSGKQKDWDLEVNIHKYQIKSAAKSKTTNRKDVDFNYEEKADINFVIIIVFDEVYNIEKIYKIPFKEAYKLVNRNNKYKVLKWSSINNKFSENLDTIYEQNEILKIFKKQTI